MLQEKVFILKNHKFVKKVNQPGKFLKKKEIKEKKNKRKKKRTRETASAPSSGHVSGVRGSQHYHGSQFLNAFVGELA